MEEIWKDIPEFEGLYQASNLGRIKSVEGKTTYSVRSGERHWKERIIKPKGCKDYRKIGYRVTLWKNKKPYDYLVARLVCTTFHENLINSNMTVNHKDGDRLNNKIDNLEWLSRADNIRHAFETSINPQDKVTLTREKDGKIMKFRSSSCASSFLGRNHGYISCKLGRGSNIAISKDGTKYYFSVEKDKGKHAMFSPESELKNYYEVTNSAGGRNPE